MKTVVTKEESTKYLRSRKKDNITKNDMSKNVMILAMKIIEYLKIKGKFERNLVKINLLFIFVFLNLWDFAISREFFNGMVLGFVMFGPAAFLWLVGTMRATVLVTLISIFEFAMISIFVLEGFELGGTATTLKSVFWIPYLLMAGVNGFWGLKIYSENREKVIRNK